MEMVQVGTQCPSGTNSPEAPAPSSSRTRRHKIHSCLRSKAVWMCAGCTVGLGILVPCLVAGLRETRETPQLNSTVVPSSSARSHFYWHFYTGVSDPSPDVPGFTAMSYVDDQQILHYDSERQREEPRGDWVQGAVDPDFWDMETRSLQQWQKRFKQNLVTLRYRYNQTRGSHTLQFMYGCEVGEDGSTGGYMQVGYDGGDFISYDLGTCTWVAGTTQARVTQQTWNEDKILLQLTRSYLEETCIVWLRQYLQHGEAALQSKHPVAEVSHRPLSWDGHTALSCRVHGFYPRDVAVVWLENGEAQPQETRSSWVLPSGDGTYQTWATIEIDPSSNHDYTCRVEHVSLGAALTVSWDKGRSKSDPMLIVGTVIGVVMLVIAGMGAGEALGVRLCPCLGAGEQDVPFTEED
ncbi:major histocompatibility complex class I-related gene protein-like isoform X1 [Alligator mississippiensis]|uniref:major histocompatibility complex class I-related gene protein-like isoform X1 n=1 Tax=Alligator mississippiensis TaxID=8496 RepID=UPI0028777F25|nr:major histocompatibility complex class I-related gene protein-like isoform X1 [Alligator mississippiensis]